MSPTTKILVSHFGRTMECNGASRRVMRRPRIMYMDAAKRAGPRRRRSVWMM